MKTYRGMRRTSGSIDVIIVEDNVAVALPHVVWHSPDGFEWGYHGSGPADLALSILADAVSEKQTRTQAKHFDPSACPRAVRAHQEFKREFIAVLDKNNPWEIDAAKVLAWIEEREKEALQVERENMASG
jgi:hypothetical protein